MGPFGVWEFWHRRNGRFAGVAATPARIFPTLIAVALALVGTPNAHADATPAADGGMADFVSVNASRGLDDVSVATLEEYFIRRGAQSTTVVHQGTLDMTTITRNGLSVEETPRGSGFPMSSLAVDPDAIAATMGVQVREVTSGGEVVVGATTAGSHRIEIGDSINLLGWNGRSKALNVGAIAPDDQVSGAELVMSIAIAASLGFDRPFSVRAWGFSVRTKAVEAGSRLGKDWVLQPIRVRYSWKDRLLDDTLPQSHVKALLGEFWVIRTSGGSLQIDPAWKAAHIVTTELPLVGSIRCHSAVAAAAGAALRELRDAGLSGLVNGTDTRIHGGCFSARETRSLVGSAGHNLSRHSWGGAIDINPTANPYGARSRMDKRVIEAFGHQGFVWGGTFLIPDPMHFEYTAQKR